MQLWGNIQVGKGGPSKEVQVISRMCTGVDTMGVNEITQVEVKRKKKKKLRMKLCVCASK